MLHSITRTDEVLLPVRYRLNPYFRGALVGLAAMMTAVAVALLQKWLREGNLWLSALISVTPALWVPVIVSALRFNIVFLTDSVQVRNGVWGESKRRYKDIVRFRLLPDEAIIQFADGLEICITALHGDIALIRDIVAPRAKPELKLEVEQS